MNEEFTEAVENKLDPSHSVTAPPTPDNHAMASQFSCKVGAALEALPPKQRTAIF